MQEFYIPVKRVEERANFLHLLFFETASGLSLFKTIQVCPGAGLLLCARRHVNKLLAKNMSIARVFNSCKTGKAQINGGIVDVCSALREFFYYKKSIYE